MKHGGAEHVIVEPGQSTKRDGNTEDALADLHKRAVMPAVYLPFNRALRFGLCQRQIFLNTHELSQAGRGSQRQRAAS